MHNMGHTLHMAQYSQLPVGDVCVVFSGARGWGLALQSTGAAPDVGEAELADVALVWRECQHGRAARRRARTSVTSLYSSGELIQTLLCGCDVYFLLAVPVLVILNQIILLILCSWCVPGGASLLLRLTDYSATMYTRPR